MPDIYLIRHGMTEGNKYQRYIGTTDEPLCPEGREEIKKISYGVPDEVFVSPMIRCRETAELLFPQKRLRIIDQLAECDFGAFENKNYQELSGNRDYQAWVDSGGALPFPEGESREQFRRRTLEGFSRVVTACIREKINTAAVVVHGGTIMNIMEAYGQPERSFYDWHVKNGHGYLIQADTSLWMRNRKLLELKKEL
ncbi:histidine phosphatase family protein [Blautia sp.]|uniref:histidine phosphatase family protein n=1 Tax=Blautia sp. TaxID=1955243 RepID=UPI003AB6C95F